MRKLAIVALGSALFACSDSLGPSRPGGPEVPEIAIALSAVSRTAERISNGDATLVIGRPATLFSVACEGCLNEIRTDTSDVHDPAIAITTAVFATGTFYMDNGNTIELGRIVSGFVPLGNHLQIAIIFDHDGSLGATLDRFDFPRSYCDYRSPGYPTGCWAVIQDSLPRSIIFELRAFYPHPPLPDVPEPTLLGEFQVQWNP